MPLVPGGKVMMYLRGEAQSSDTLPILLHSQKRSLQFHVSCAIEEREDRTLHPSHPSQARERERGLSTAGQRASGPGGVPSGSAFWGFPELSHRHACMERFSLRLTLTGDCKPIFWLIWALCLCSRAASELWDLETRLPDHPAEAESYLCTQVALPPVGEEPLQIIGIEPLSSEKLVHHMLLFGNACCWRMMRGQYLHLLQEIQQQPRFTSSKAIHFCHKQ